MESTLPRAQFLALMQELGQAGSVELVETVLVELGWADKQEFTKGDVTIVMAGVAKVARREFDNPAAYGGADEATRGHVRGMLDALDAVGDMLGDWLRVRTKSRCPPR